MDQMESNGLHSTKASQVVSCCISTRALKQASRMDQIDQMESNGPIRLSLIKWSNGILLLEHSGRKASESNGSNRSNEVEWTFD